MPRSGSKLSSRTKRGKRSGKRSRKKSSKRVNRSRKRTYREASDIPYPPLERVDASQYVSFEEVENAAKILDIPPEELEKFDSTELGAIESFLNTVKKFDPKVYKDNKQMIDELKKKGIMYEQEIKDLHQKGKNTMLFLQKGKDELGEKLALMEEEVV